jgi:uncharacterized metal-binding protein YceD (DUF177 family)
MSALPAISRRVELASIGATQSIRRIELDEHERNALRASLGLIDIVALSAEIGLSRDRDGTIHLGGRLSAGIVQECVVSLEPVRQVIDEPIDLRFVEDAPGRSPAVVDVAPTEDDPPEIVIDPFLDLGPIVVEQFLLAIDPYPRAPAAEPPDNPAGENEGGHDSPFSVLAPLIGAKPQPGNR